MKMILALSLAATVLTGTAPAQSMPPGRGAMRVDLNSDGVITRAEAIAEANARFARLDRDRDGTITPSERRAVRSMHRHTGNDTPPKQRQDATATAAQFRDRALNRFDRMDTNRDGRLDGPEIAAMRDRRDRRVTGHAPVLPQPGQTD